MATTVLVERRDAVKSLEKALLSALTIARLQKVEVTTNDGRYRIVRMLGRGASGVVCEAKDRRMERPVALKLYPGIADDRHAGAIRDEAKRLARPQHQNVVVVHDYNAAHLEPGKIPCFYVAMELLSGSSLRQWLAQRQRADEIVRVFRQAGAGLAAAHRVGLVHRDFKPENVVLVDGVPKIVDFGLATDEPLAATRLSTRDPQERTIVGTLAYMAPEALEGRADARSDQFAFAAALWEALYGEFPYPIESVDPADRRTIAAPARASAYPEALRRCLARALSGDPRKRFVDMQELVERLREFEASLADAPPASASNLAVAEVQAERREPRPRRSSWWVVAPLVVLAGVATLGLAAYDGDLESWIDGSAGRERQGRAIMAAQDAAEIAVAGGAAKGEGEVDATPPSGEAPPPGAEPCARETGWGGTWEFSTNPGWERPQLTPLIGKYALEIAVKTPSCQLDVTVIKRGIKSSKGTKSIEHRAQVVGSLIELGAREALVLTGVDPHQQGAAAKFLYDLALLREGDALAGDFHGMSSDGERAFSGRLRGRRTGAQEGVRGDPLCDPAHARRLAGKWRFEVDDELGKAKPSHREYDLELAASGCELRVRRDGVELGSGVAYGAGLWRLRIDEGKLRREWTLAGDPAPKGVFRTLEGPKGALRAKGTISARRR
ncbi:MAG: serine/threonine protein kinase [Myxococcales bacterium]|nr:serine/threonine protein kinase [Myxococcales bacterium]